MKTKKIKWSWSVLPVFILLVIYSLTFVFLLSWGLLTSVKSFRDFGTPNYNILGFPDLAVSKEQLFKLANYTTFFKKFLVQIMGEKYYFGDILIEHPSGEANIWIMLLNTLMYTVGCSFLLAVVPAITGYMCAKYKYKFSSFLYYLLLTLMTIPTVGIYPSEITLLRNLGLYDTMIGIYIQKFSCYGMYFFVFHAFFESIPDTYSEAAEIDGASQFTIMVRIMMPLAVKMIGTVMLIQFIHLWNDYQTAYLYLPSYPTLAYGVWYVNFQGGGELGRTPVRVASCMTLAIPVLIIFSFFKDKIMGNVSMGGIKG